MHTLEEVDRSGWQVLRLAQRSVEGLFFVSSHFVAGLACQQDSARCTGKWIVNSSDEQDKLYS